MKLLKKFNKARTFNEKCILFSLVVLLFLFCYLIWSESNYKAIIDRIPDHTKETREYSEEDTNNPVRVLLNGDDTITAKYQNARDKKANIENNFIKDKRGLNAQEGMWKVTAELYRLTVYQLILLLITTVISGIGLYYIYKTFRETQRVNTLQLQPWLTIGKPTVSFTRLFHGPVATAHFFIYFPIKIQGITPLKCITIDIPYVSVDMHHSEYGFMECLATDEGTVANFSPVIEDEFISEEANVYMIKSDKDKLTRPSPPDGEHWFKIEFDIRFKDSFTNPSKHRRIPVTAQRDLSTSTITKISVGQETEEFDGSRFDLDYWD